MYLFRLQSLKFPFFIIRFRGVYSRSFNHSCPVRIRKILLHKFIIGPVAQHFHTVFDCRKQQLTQFYCRFLFIPGFLPYTFIQVCINNQVILLSACNGEPSELPPGVGFVFTDANEIPFHFKWIILPPEFFVLLFALYFFILPGLFIGSPVCNPAPWNHHPDSFRLIIFLKRCKILHGFEQGIQDLHQSG